MIPQSSNGAQTKQRAPLADHHLQMLTDGSGIAAEVIEERGYFTSSGYQELRQLGLVVPSNTHTLGLLIPVFTPDGARPTHFIAKTNSAVPLTVYRPDAPAYGKDGRARKYILPYQALPRLNCHPRSVPAMLDPHVPLWITEGCKKADALVSHGACALDIGGVWSWMGSNAQGGKSTALPDWRDIALPGRDVRLVFDSDITVKPAVAYALRALTAYLQSKGAAVSMAFLPDLPGGKCGVDDYLLTHELHELKALLQPPAIRPVAKKRPTIAFIEYKNGDPKPLLANVMAVLEDDPAWDGVLKYNAFSHKTELHNAPPRMPTKGWACRELKDTDTCHVTRVIQDKYEMSIGRRK